MEAWAHLLPMNDDELGNYDADEDNGNTILEMSLLDHEIEYMTENKTLELPANFFRGRLEPQQGGRRLDILQYATFQLRPTFPHNIALMKTGEIVYCTGFDNIIQPSGRQQVIIYGYAFKEVLAVYIINIIFNYPVLYFIILAMLHCPSVNFTNSDFLLFMPKYRWKTRSTFLTSPVKLGW